MASGGQQHTTLEYSATTMSPLPPPYVVNMDAIPEGIQPPSSEYSAAMLNLPPSAPVYSAIDMQDQSQSQVAGWNSAIYPSPPPYSETAFHTQAVLMPQILKTELRDIPGQAVCPSCNLLCVTKTEYKSGCLTTLICCLLFFFGCVLGCCLIPCCVNSCKDVDHYCPNCNHLIHKYKRL